jgi:hypothetical protein
MIQIISAILIMLLFAVWNGCSINFYNSKDLKWNKYFHYVGFVLRGLLIAMFWGDWVTMLILANLSYTAYEMIINLMMKQNIFYIGETSKIDILFGKLGFVLKIVLFLLSIYIISK